MKEREFYLPSCDGRSRLRCLEWIPDGEVLATVQISHGMVEHIGRYREFGIWLAERGIAVYGHDHLGHGKTSAPEDLGYFAEKNGASCVIRDIRRLTRYGMKKYPGVRHFLLGHSMGSFFARAYLTVYDDGPDGVILSGTGGQPLPLVAAGYGLCRLVCAIDGDRGRNRLLFKLSTGDYNRAFRPNVTGCDWLTRDVEKARAYEQDEFCRFRFTNGAYRDFFGLILRLTQLEKAGEVRTDVPVLFLSGDQDPVGERTHGVRRVFKRYHSAGLEDLTLGFYSGARHEILNETNREEVYTDILDWIRERI